MRRLIGLLLSSTLPLLCVHALGQVSVPSPASPTGLGEDPVLLSTPNAHLESVRRRGVDLYERHWAALMALEAGRELGLLELDSDGWIVLRDADALTVRFVAACPEGPCSVLDVEISGERLSARALYPPEHLGTRGRLARRARNLVLSSQTATCAVPYNVVTFPPDAQTLGWAAYLIAQPEDQNFMAIGGHMRVYLDAEARTMLTAQDFSPACQLVRRDASRREFRIDYFQAPLPAEVHVLQSLLHQVILLVATRAGVFTVNGDELWLSDDGASLAAP